MSAKHAIRRARVQQMQRLEAKLATLRPQVEQDLRDLIGEFQDAGVSARLLGRQVGRTACGITALSSGRRVPWRALSTWAAKLLAYWETAPWEQVRQRDKDVGRLLRQANKMRGASVHPTHWAEIEET